MIEVEFNYDRKCTKGILLGKYQGSYEKMYSEKKKIFGKMITKTIYQTRIVQTTFYIVFIPWIHQEKELIEVDEKDMIHPEMLPVDANWIQIDKFVSKACYDEIYHQRVEVENFIGYKFIYENNNFITNLRLHETTENLTILYKEMPEILDVRLENKEE